MEEKNLTFTEKIIKKSSEPFHFIKSTDIFGDQCYHIIMAPQAKIEAMMKAESEQVDLLDYGKVVASEYGHKPSQKVINMLKDKYEIDFYAYFKLPREE